MVTIASTDRPAHDAGRDRLSFIDRFLPLWIVLAMAIGIGLGRVFPDLGEWLDRVKGAGASLPLAAGWLGRAVGRGCELGLFLPELGEWLDRVKVAGVSLPIAVGLLWMMYPVLAKV